MRDPRRALVRAGYDQVGHRYLDARPVDGGDVALLDEFAARFAAGSQVLDAGCGAGVPVVGRLGAAGLRVVGLDLSGGQLALCRSRGHRIDLVQGDLAAFPIAAGRLDGVVSFYAVIHVPRADHGSIFQEFWRVLRRGGAALLCLGARDLEADHDPESWLGTPMFWSHFDAGTNLEMLGRVGFDVQWARIVDDPMSHGQHLFVLATHP